MALILEYVFLSISSLVLGAIVTGTIWWYFFHERDNTESDNESETFPTEQLTTPQAPTLQPTTPPSTTPPQKPPFIDSDVEDRNNAYHAIIACNDVLITELSASPEEIAGILVSKFFIPPAMQEVVGNLHTTKRHRATILVQAVENKVKINQRRFNEFVQILKKFTWTKDVVNKLEETYTGELLYMPSMQATTVTKLSNNYYTCMTH